MAQRGDRRETPAGVALGLGVALIAVLAAPAACSSSGLCPCGSDVEQPLADHDLAFGGAHELDGECACRCGDGPLRAFPSDPDGTCDLEGLECEEADEAPATLRCE